MNRLVASAATLVAGAAAVVAAAGPAGAAGEGCTLAPPSRISVTSPTRDVSAQLVCSDPTATATGTTAGWEARMPSVTEGITGVVAHGTATATTVTFPVNDSDRRGVWTWAPLGVRSSSGAVLDVTQNTGMTSDVRLGTSGYLVLTRSGTSMTFYARTSRWSPYYGKWIGYKPDPAAYIQWRSDTGTWTRLRTLAPDSGGVTRGSFSVPADKLMHYQIVIPDSTTTGTFGTISPDQRK